MQMFSLPFGPFPKADAGDGPSRQLAGPDQRWTAHRDLGRDGHRPLFLDEFTGMSLGINENSPPPGAIRALREDVEAALAARSDTSLPEALVPQTWLDAGFDPEALSIESLRAVFETIRAQNAEQDEPDLSPREMLEVLVEAGFVPAEHEAADWSTVSPGVRRDVGRDLPLAASSTHAIDYIAPRDTDRHVPGLTLFATERNGAVIPSSWPDENSPTRVFAEGTADGSSRNPAGSPAGPLKTSPDSPVGPGWNTRLLPGSGGDGQSRADAAIGEQGDGVALREAGELSINPPHHSDVPGQGPIRAGMPGFGSGGLTQTHEPEFVRSSGQPSAGGAPRTWERVSVPGSPPGAFESPNRGDASIIRADSPGSPQTAGVDAPVRQERTVSDNKLGMAGPGSISSIEPNTTIAGGADRSIPDISRPHANSEPARATGSIGIRRAGGMIAPEDRVSGITAAGSDPMFRDGETFSSSPMVTLPRREELARPSAFDNRSGPGATRDVPTAADGSTARRPDPASEILAASPVSGRMSESARQARGQDERSGAVPPIRTPDGLGRAEMTAPQPSIPAGRAWAEADGRSLLHGSQPAGGAERDRTAGQGPQGVAGSGMADVRSVASQPLPSVAPSDRLDPTAGASVVAEAPSDRAAPARVTLPAHPAAESRTSTPGLSAPAAEAGRVMPAFPLGAPSRPLEEVLADRDGSEPLAGIRHTADGSPLLRAGAVPQATAHHVSSPVHISRQIASALQGSGQGSYEISLSPDELGKVRIGLTPAEAGISVSIFADRPETLDLLRRHADLLAQEFRDIGYGSVDFSFASGDDAGHHLGSGAAEREARYGAADLGTTKRPLPTGAVDVSARPARDGSGRMDIRI